MTITGEQLRAARAFVRIEQTDLAQRAGVSVHTIKRLEATVGVLSASMNMMAPILAALNAAGVEFIPESEGGPGVRVRKL